MKENNNIWKVALVLVVLIGIAGVSLTVLTDMNDPDVGTFRDDDYTKDTPRNDAVTMDPVPIATTAPTRAVDDTGDVVDHLVWNSSFDVHEFDGTIENCCQYPHNRDYDIGDEFTIRMWFRRDVFNKQQFFLSKGHWEDKLGWRFMVKQTKPPYQAEQIQFDVGDGSELNYYKTLQGITDSDWHCIVFVWNANKIYVDSKGMATHGALILDGKADYYMARSDTKKPAISEVKPYRKPMHVGRHFCKDKFFFVGAMANIEMLDTDIGIDGAVEYYKSTKDAYPPTVA